METQNINEDSHLEDDPVLFLKHYLSAMDDYERGRERGLERSWQTVIAAERALNDFVLSIATRYVLRSASPFAPFVPLPMLAQYRVQLQAAKVYHRDRLIALFGDEAVGPL